MNLSQKVLDESMGAPPPSTVDVDAIVKRERRRAGLRTTGLASLTVAITFAIVATFIWLPRMDRAPTTPIGDQSAPQVIVPSVDIPPLTFMFDAYTVGRFDVHIPREVSTTYQLADIATGTAFVGTLTVYRPGVRPSHVTTGSSVTIDGLPAYASQHEQYLNKFDGKTGAIIGSVDVLTDTLAWQYAPNSWATIEGYVEQASQVDLRLTAADERALAENFHLGQPSRAKMPFRVGYLPDGWTAVLVSGRPPLPGFISVIFAPSRMAATDKVRHFRDGQDGPAAIITILPNQNVPDAPKNPPTCGHFVPPNFSCHWDIPNTRYGVLIEDPTSTLSQSDLTKIKDGLTFDNLDNPDTWHPVQ